MSLRRFILSIFAAATLTAVATTSSNVIITEYHSDFYVEVAKDGVTPVKIKNKQAVTYIATRTPTVAILHTYYDDFVKIDKAKAKGGKPIYAKAKSAGVFFDDSRVCYLLVPLEKLFTKTTATIELTMEKPELFCLDYFFDLYPIQKYYFSLHLPVALKDKYDIAFSNPPAEYEIDRSLSPDGKEYVISVVASELPAIFKEDDSPSVRHYAPYVSILGQFGNVDELYDRFSSYVQKDDPGAAAVLAKANEITANCGNDIEKIDAVQRWVHDNIRYVAIENGDLGHAPDLPSQVLEKRFGDCKGSASLIAGMLQSLGIEGRRTWIGTSSIPDDWTDRPQFSTGNHMIASVVLPDTIIYIDGTTGPTDFGFLPPSLQGKQTIIEDGEKCIVGRVPLLPPASNTDSISAVLRLEGNTLSGTISDYLTGTYKATMISVMRDVDSKNREKSLIAKLALGRKNVRLSSIVTDNLTAGGGAGSITADITIPNVVTSAGDKNYLSIATTFPNINNFLIDVKDRHNPATLSMRRNIIVENSIALPEGFEVAAIPDDFHVANKWVDAKLDFDREPVDGVLTYRLHYIVLETEIPLEEIPAYNSDLKQLIKSISQNVTLLKL